MMLKLLFNYIRINMMLAHCVFKKNGKVFAVERNDKPLKGIYSLPGGKIQKGETGL